MNSDVTLRCIGTRVSRIFFTNMILCLQLSKIHLTKIYCQKWPGGERKNRHVAVPPQRMAESTCNHTDWREAVSAKPFGGKLAGCTDSCIPA
jgi:hypothetical protein